MPAFVMYVSLTSCDRVMMTWINCRKSLTQEFDIYEDPSVDLDVTSATNCTHAVLDATSIRTDISHVAESSSLERYKVYTTLGHHVSSPTAGLRVLMQLEKEKVWVNFATYRV